MGDAALTLDSCGPVLTVAEAAVVARVDPKTIRQAVHRGELPALVTGAGGRVIRIHRDALRSWINGEKPGQLQLRRPA